MVTTYPIYILELEGKDLVVFPESKADIPHPQFFQKDIIPIIANYFGISDKRLMNIPYCQRRARISSKGFVFYGEKQTKTLLRTISKATGETNLRWVFDDHEARLPFDVMEFERLIRDT